VHASYLAFTATLGQQVLAALVDVHGAVCRPEQRQWQREKQVNTFLIRTNM